MKRPNLPRKGMASEDGTYKLSLEENLHDSIRRSLLHSHNALKDEREWKFAVLTLAHGVELTLKKLLREAHPWLLLEDIDRPSGNSVSVAVAVERVHRLLGEDFSQGDQAAIHRVRKWRNSIAHADFSVNLHEVRASYYLLMAWLNEFHGQHLGAQLSAAALDGNWKILVDDTGAYSREMMQRIEKLAKAGKLDAASVLVCPRCEQRAFYTSNADRCYNCGHVELLGECDNCKRVDFETQFSAIDFGNMRRLTLVKEFCIECMRKLMAEGIRGSIEYVAEELEDELEDYWYWRAMDDERPEPGPA